MMNQNNLQQIFSHYIEKFAYINDDTHYETYKWKVAKEFRALMDEALSKNGQEFTEALKKAKASTQNIIDSYTQPFHGLVEFAKIEPDTVKQMFIDLYTEDGGDLEKQKRLIADFFAKSQVLLDRYYPDSYRYKQNSHSVSAYLFLYDPDHHYMYKASHASIFADCIEFYDDWGLGDNIKLEVYYRMCDEVVKEIKNNKALLITDDSRFDSRMNSKPEDLFEDTEKHMLTFDLIYCCSSYSLFDGISFTRPKTKEKILYLEEEKKAMRQLEEFNKLKEEYDLLVEARKYFVHILEEGTEVRHKTYGLCIVESIDEKVISVLLQKTKEKKRLQLDTVLAKGIVKVDRPGFEEHLEEYMSVLKQGDSLKRKLEKANKKGLGQ